MLRVLRSFDGPEILMLTAASVLIISITLLFRFVLIIVRIRGILSLAPRDHLS
jgi:hypothetical protein